MRLKLKLTCEDRMALMLTNSHRPEKVWFAYLLIADKELEDLCPSVPCPWASAPIGK
jgi:hypothetical protein